MFLPLFQALTPEVRAAALVARMSISERIAQLMMDAPAIPRLGVPAYHWWNEALHGVARNGVATVFPQAIGLAATWDPMLMGRVATAISIEARAKHNVDPKGIYHGITLWSPNVNIFRDPRWGRGQETYGEDPFLTGRMGVAFVRGIQGDGEVLRCVATPKHFAVHSGPEPLRHSFDAIAPERDVYETYLPQFEACVREGRAQSVMSAYSAFNGVPATGNPYLLTTLLRETWGFDGAVVSDVDSVHDLWAGHKVVKDAAEASAMALKAGDDLCSGDTYRALPEALKRGLVSEGDIDRAATRLFTLRYRLGMFDHTAYDEIPASEIDSPAHDALNLETAEKSLVLLKNDGALPFSSSVRKIAVIGPTADDLSTLVGNYNGTPSHPVTILAGIRRRLEGTALHPPAPSSPGTNPPRKEGVTYAKGCALTETPGQPVDESLRDEAVATASGADAVVLCLGITPKLEGEEMRVNAEGFKGGDRTAIELPKPQRELLAAMRKTGKPVVVVLTGGSALAFDPSGANAVLDQWYSGGRGGDAVAAALFGDFNPAGRLPVTFYRATKDLPPFESYAMAGRTYRYFGGKPLFPFGFGLSYTRFAYGKPTTASGKDGWTLSVPVTNGGGRDGEEVVQLYAHPAKPQPGDARRSLVAFERVRIARGETKTVSLVLPRSRLRVWDVAKKAYVVRPGDYVLEVGASSANVRGRSGLRLGN